MKTSVITLCVLVCTMVVSLWCGCTTQTFQIEGPHTMDALWENILRWMPDGSLESEVLELEESLRDSTPPCPCHGFPDQALHAYVSDVVGLSRDLDWRMDLSSPEARRIKEHFLYEPGVEIESLIRSRPYFTRGRLLALAATEVRLPKDCKYYEMIERVRADATKNVSEIVRMYMSTNSPSCLDGCTFSQ